MTEPAFISRWRLLQAVVFLLLIVIIAGASGVYVLSDRQLQQSLLFAQTALQIEELYGQVVDRRDLIQGAREGMFGILDRYSSYLEPEQFNRLEEEFTGAYGGIGISVVGHEQGLLIMSVREDGPAGKVGLLSGDIIIIADSVDLSDVRAADATTLLRGEPGTEVNISVIRPATADTLQFTLERRNIDLIHVAFAGLTPDGVIYIRLLDFGGGSSDDVEAALDSLMALPDRRPAGVILDLRSNPGGLLQEAYRTADLFLDGGQLIVGTDGRSRWNEERHFSSGSDRTGGLPMAILVDGGSASASEIVAGALQQLGRAVLVGDTTFGKGLVQGFSKFPDGSGTRLTISRYYLDGGLYINRFDSTLDETGSGLAPDYPLSFVEQEAFPRALEYSLLLQQFANEYQDRIIEDYRSSGLDTVWVEQFARYAAENGFEYRSEVTESAREIQSIIWQDYADSRLREVADRLVASAQRDDSLHFVKYADYIRFRLAQLAIERKDGRRRAYEEVVIRHRADIRYCVDVLQKTARAQSQDLP
jgi:carboxyl-terminal processing protease